MCVCLRIKDCDDGPCTVPMKTITENIVESTEVSTAENIEKKRDTYKVLNEVSETKVVKEIATEHVEVELSLVKRVSVGKSIEIKMDPLEVNIVMENRGYIREDEPED